MGEKKAHQQEHTPLDGQKNIGNGGGARFCPSGKVP